MNTFFIEEKSFSKPMNTSNMINRFRINRFSKKTIKLLEKEGSDRIVLSNDLKNIVLLKNNLYSENINILNGRLLFKCLSKNIIEYILNIRKQEICNSKIHILVNDFTKLNIDIIIDISKSVKTVNIITNNINKCKRIENKLYNEFGILLNVVNNRKTSLLKSDIILNIDYPEELVNKYRINTKAIIINTNEKIEIHNKKFNGVNVSFYKLQMPKEYKMNGFCDEEIYESIIYDYSYKEMKKRINEDKIKIKCLVGNKGNIQEQEFNY